jgi:hypothetical protein
LDVILLPRNDDFHAIPSRVDNMFFSHRCEFVEAIRQLMRVSLLLVQYTALVSRVSSTQGVEFMHDYGVSHSFYESVMQIFISHLKTKMNAAGT